MLLAAPSPCFCELDVCQNRSKSFWCRIPALACGTRQNLVKIGFRGRHHSNFKLHQHRPQTVRGIFLLASCGHQYVSKQSRQDTRQVVKRHIRHIRQTRMHAQKGNAKQCKQSKGKQIEAKPAKKNKAEQCRTIQGLAEQGEAGRCDAVVRRQVGRQVNRQEQSSSIPDLGSQAPERKRVGKESNTRAEHVMRGRST